VGRSSRVHSGYIPESPTFVSVLKPGRLSNTWYIDHSQEVQVKVHHYVHSESFCSYLQVKRTTERKNCIMILAQVFQYES